MHHLLRFYRRQQRYNSLRRIADVNISQNALQTFFGITSIVINEQVGLGRTTTLNGLSMQDAEKIMHIISQHITKTGANL